MTFRIIVAAALLFAPLPSFAQSQQEDLDARYDRALAAGYKSLFLCGAIANAERAGTIRSPESVIDWELEGIQAPLDDIVDDLPFEIVRSEKGTVRFVATSWAEDMPPRYAVHRLDAGCSIYPIGFTIENLPAEPTVEPYRPRRLMPLTKGYNSHRYDSTKFFDGTYGEGTRTTAVIVHSPTDTYGYYADGFDRDTPQRTWSVAKSIAATLVGAAIQRGDFAMALSHPEIPVPLPILGWYGSHPDNLENDPSADPRIDIAMDNLLRMASGRYSDTPGNRTDPLYFGGSTVRETALHWPVINAPGTVFRYANNDTLAAVEAIAPTFEENSPADFFNRIGMHRTVAETDWQGDYVLSSQVWATAPDLLELGKLYLNDGMRGRERILPEGWVDYVSRPSGPQPDGAFGYGAGFWLLNKSDGVPPDTFAAMGNRGQFIIIVPSRKVVIVRRGEDPAGHRFDVAAFTRDVLAGI